MPSDLAPPFVLLLVEDEPADAQIFTELLSDLTDEIRVEHVRNGQEALEYLSAPHSLRPELIALDLNMPVMGGHEFLIRAKADPLLRMIPVLVLSTSEHPRDIHGAYNNHANGYVVKPSNIAEYQMLLERIMGYWQGAVRLPRIEELSV